MFALERKQPALGRQSSAVARERPIAANYAVTGNNNSHWIGAVGHTDRAGGSRAADNPDVSRAEAKAARLRRYAELRWSVDTSPAL